MDGIPFAQLDPGYAEYGSQLGTDFKIWYRSARESSSDLLSALKAAGVLEYMAFQRVPLSRDDLLAGAGKVYDALVAAKLPVGVTIDTASGAVLLHAYESNDKAATTAAAAEIASGFGVNFRWGDDPPVNVNYGGRNADFPDPLDNSACTAGFVVFVPSNGDTRVTSAAHCGRVGSHVVYNGGSGFTVTTRTYDSDHDVLTFDRAGETWNAKVKYATDGTTRDVHDVKYWQYMNVGDPVSKFGRHTGYTLGHIVDKSACGGAPPCDPWGHWVRVEVNSGSQMCAGGDSGGPAMYNFTAYGLMTQRYTDGDCVFMPQEDITGGVVLTQ